MVPGVFKTVIPCLKARPDLGLTWASMPVGIETEIPHAIISFSHGGIVISLFIEAHKSTPEASFD